MIPHRRLDPMLPFRPRDSRPTALPSLPAVCAYLALTLLVSALLACGDATGPGEDVVLQFDFSAADQAFVADFSDVAVAQADAVGFVGEHRGLPQPLEGNGLFHSGLNLSDDLFMFFTRRVTGLEPGASYRATFELEIASNAGEDCTIGVGAGVLVKAGAAREEVRRVVVQGNGQEEYRLSVDKGEQANDGEAGVILGDIRNGLPGCDDELAFDREEVAAPGKEVVVQADDEGGIWVYFGTESTFEVRHSTYFTRFRVGLSRR